MYPDEYLIILLTASFGGYIIIEIIYSFTKPKLNIMQINTNYNGKDISITLTKEQIQEITNQTSNIITIENLDYNSAKTLLIDNGVIIDPKNLYKGKLLELITIIKAANFLDNGNKEWIPNFESRKEYKYYPYFRKENGVWSVYDCGYGCGISAAVVVFFKKEETAKFIGNKYLDLYTHIID
jgi:hypothetical protein